MREVQTVQLRETSLACRGERRMLRWILWNTQPYRCMRCTAVGHFAPPPSCILYECTVGQASGLLQNATFTAGKEATAHAG